MTPNPNDDDDSGLFDKHAFLTIMPFMLNSDGIIKKFKTSKESASDVFLMRNRGRESIVKKPRGLLPGHTTPEFEECQKAEVDARTALVDCEHNINIPKIIETGPDHVILEPAPGTPMSEELISSLSPEQLEKHITDFAEFLNAMHQHTAVKRKSTYAVPNIEIAKYTLQYYKESISSKDFRRVEAAYRSIKNRQFIADYTVFAHCDLHPGNILFDRKSGQTSIIDFGASGFAHHYHDAVAPDTAISNGLLSTQIEIMDRYNDMPKKHPIYFKKYQIWQLYEYVIYTVQAEKHIFATKRAAEKFGKYFSNAIQPTLLKLDLAFGVKSGR